jgi:hypothetical protein
LRHRMMSKAKGVSEAAGSTVIARQKRTAVSGPFKVIICNPIELVRLP